MCACHLQREALAVLLVRFRLMMLDLILLRPLFNLHKNARR
jgi:hypothetical protein